MPKFDVNQTAKPNFVNKFVYEFYQNANLKVEIVNMYGGNSTELITKEKRFFSQIPE